MFNGICVLAGIALLLAGVITIKEGIQKRKFDKSFAEGFGMVVFGTILMMAWLSILFK